MRDHESYLTTQDEIPLFEDSFQKKYLKQEALGQGGMGQVLSAVNANLRRSVAIKKLHSGVEDELSKKLFIREAQITGQLEHPNIVPVYEIGTDDHGQIFYSMKKIDGIPLDRILEGIKAGKRKYITRFPLSQLLNIFTRICEAIEYALAKGIIHLDIKPENIMIGHYGEVLVLDWGIARFRKKKGTTYMEPVTLEPSARCPVDMDEASCRVVGTPAFMAPEQATGSLDMIGTRTDVYALGTILYNILTLHPPGEGQKTTQILKSVAIQDFKDPLEYNKIQDSDFVLNHCPDKQIPEALAAICRKAMQTDLGKRYPSAYDLHDDVEAHIAGYSTNAEELSLVGEFRLLCERHKEAAFIILGSGLLNIILLALYFSN